MSSEFESLKQEYANLVAKSDGLTQQNVTLTLRLEEIERLLQIHQKDIDELKKKGGYAPGNGIGSLQTIGNPLGVQQYAMSQRTFNEKLRECKNRREVDEYGRQVDLNTLPYYSCPGDDPDIAVKRENAISRLGYNQLQPYPSSVPQGLLI